MSARRTNRARPFRASPRRGATVVESAILLPVLILVLFAMLDLGLAAVRYNSLAEASRRIAREAIKHGSLSAEWSDMWGTAEYSGNAADGSDFVAPVKGMLPTMNDEHVSVEVTWPDGDNSPRDRVRVETEYEHDSLIPGLFPWGPLELQSVTTMHIVN